MEHISLEKLKPRQRARIASYRGDMRLAQRLSDLGLTPNSEVVVMRKGKNSPLDLLVRRTRLAIAHDVAKCILVEIVP